MCGRIGSFGQPLRLPRTIASASAATPALMCTTVPPAKSSAPRSNSQPALPPSSPSDHHTQWAIGKYTSVAQTTANTTQAPNLARSATAPLIRATVMMANVAWNATNTSCGMPVPSSAVAAVSRPTRPQSPNPPMNELSPPPEENVRE